MDIFITLLTMLFNRYKVMSRYSSSWKDKDFIVIDRLLLKVDCIFDIDYIV